MTITGYRLPNGTVPVLLSAASAGLVTAEAAALLSYVTAHPKVTPQPIAAMLFRTRTARPHRALAMVTGRDELLSACAAIVDGREHPRVVRTSTPAIARGVGFVFPGQGSQRPGMGRIFYHSVPAFRAEADRCADAFQAETGAAPLDYLLTDEIPAEDSAGNVQPALFSQLAGLAAMWRSFGIDPKATIGHSQGEIAAAYAAGVITLTDAVRVIAIRARAADDITGDYAMAIIAADRDTCAGQLARCSGWAELSVVNSPGITGISGERATVRGVVDTLTERGVFARVIGVHYPAHTSLIDQLEDRVRAETRRRLQNPTFLDADTACVGGTLGGPITSDLPVDRYWFANLRNTVRFDKAVTAALPLGVDTFVELAEHPTLQLAIEENLAVAGGGRSTAVVGTSRRMAADLDAFTGNLAQLAVNDLNYPWHRLAAEAGGPPPLPLVDFPNTRMNEAVFWLAYADEVSRPVIETAQPRLLTERWVRLSQRALAAPRTIGVVDCTGNRSDLIGPLETAAADLGATVRMVGVNSHTESAVADLDAFDTLAILAPQSPQLDDGAAAAEVSAFFSNRTRWPELTETVTECWLVTVGGEAVVGDDPPPDPVHAALGAGFRAIGAEHPQVGFRHLDVAAGSISSNSAAAILSALHTTDEPELALRNGSLYAKRITGDTPGGTNVVESDTTPPEHVLIIGGTGNLGLEFCAHFAQRGARRVTLVSRSGQTDKIADRLRRIRSGTATQIDTIRCDVGDKEAVARLAQQCGEAPADLIIHAALAYSDAEFADITAEQADQVLRAKVVGISRVLETFPRTDDCRVVLCSSVAATIGGRGQIIYAAANRMLDAMAHRLRAEGLDCVSVQWGQWTVHFDLDPTGWAKLAATGLLPMRPADAIPLGLSRIRQNFVVAAFDLGRARPMLAAYGYGPLLSQLIASDADEPTSARVVDVDPGQHLMRLLAGAIGVEDVDVIDTTVPLVAVGLDSLQALEFHRRVKAELNHDLAVSDLLGGASIADVLERLGAGP